MVKRQLMFGREWRFFEKLFETGGKLRRQLGGVKAVPAPNLQNQGLEFVQLLHSIAHRTQLRSGGGAHERQAVWNWRRRLRVFSQVREHLREIQREVADQTICH